MENTNEAEIITQNGRRILVLNRKSTAKTYVNIVLLKWLGNGFQKYSTHIENTSRGKNDFCLGHYFDDIYAASSDFLNRV